MPRRRLYSSRPARLSIRADVRLAQALRPEGAALAAGFCAFKADAASTLDDGIGGAEFEGVAGGAEAGFCLGIELKVFGLKPARDARRVVVVFLWACADTLRQSAGLGL
jgi:hypothetical protein